MARRWFTKRSNTVSAAVTVSTTSFEVPGNEALIIEAASLLFTPGSTQYIVNGYATATPPGDTISSSSWTEWLQAAGEQGADRRLAINLPRAVIIPPRWQIQAQGVFNAGANSNGVTLSIWGFLLDRVEAERLGLQIPS